MHKQTREDRDIQLKLRARLEALESRKRPLHKVGYQEWFQIGKAAYPMTRQRRVKRRVLLQDGRKGMMLAWIREIHPLSYHVPGQPTGERITAQDPAARVEIMAQRHERCEGLYHPQDLRQGGIPQHLHWKKFLDGRELCVSAEARLKPGETVSEQGARDRRAKKKLTLHEEVKKCLARQYGHRDRKPETKAQVKKVLAESTPISSLIQEGAAA